LIEGDFIMRETSSGTFNAVRKALAQSNISISNLNVLITLGNAEAIAMAVQEGIGVGFVSKPVVDRMCRGHVAEVRVRGMDVCRQIYIGRNSRRPATNAQKAFWEFITSESHEKLEV
jgi:DNA-binding transcriptional LysR family regulator